MRVCVWMNQPSHYQSAFFRALHVQLCGNLHIIYDQNLSPERLALGWEKLRPEAFRQTLLGNWRHAISVAWSERSSVHIINGVWGVKRFIPVSLLLLLSGAVLFFYSECPEPNRRRNLILELTKSTWLNWSMLHAAGIFVIGVRAAMYYQSRGVPTRKIYRTMYLTEVEASHYTREPSVIPTVIYVGQFTERKNVTLLIRAFARRCGKGRLCNLLLIGSGELRDSYINLGKALQIKDQVILKGSLSPSQVIEYLRTSWVLVLPSKFDGWGLVVQEALLCGVPVICSTECGASELIQRNPDWGIVFAPDNENDLADAIEKFTSTSIRRICKIEVENSIGIKIQTAMILNVLKSNLSTYKYII